MGDVMENARNVVVQNESPTACSALRGLKKPYEEPSMELFVINSVVMGDEAFFGSTYIDGDDENTSGWWN